MSTNRTGNKNVSWKSFRATRPFNDSDRIIEFFMDSEALTASTTTALIGHTHGDVFSILH